MQYTAIFTSVEINNFQIKRINVTFVLKTFIKADLKNTHNLCFKAELRNIILTCKFTPQNNFNDPQIYTFGPCLTL